MSRRPRSGITPLERRILRLLDSCPRRLADLLAQLGCSRQGLRDAGARMEAFGWLRRGLRWTATAAGRRQVHRRALLPRRPSRRRGAQPGELAALRSARPPSSSTPAASRI